jgi:hypothetical protein
MSNMNPERITVEQVLNALQRANVVGAWEIEYDGALFIRGVAEFEGDPDIWSVTLDTNGEVME